MSDWDDLEDVTPRISSEDAERLLSGTAGIDGIHDLSDLSTVLDALREPADATELSGLPAVLVAFGAADVTAHSDPSTPRTLPMKKRLTRKSLAAIGVITLVSAGAAAAAGVVPTPFSASRPSVATSTHGDTDDSTDETIAEDTAVDTTPTTDEVEADETTEVAQVDDADNAGKVAEPADATVSTDGQGPDVNGPAKFGLCTAYAARTKHDVTTTTLAGATATAEPLPVPFQSLSDAADAAGQTVAEFCADAVPGGSADAPGQSGDNPSATAPGHSGDNPSATAPGHSGDNPSATAPGHSGDNPSATAPGHSGDNPGAAHGPATTHP
jgi:hypothetical protein